MGSTLRTAVFLPLTAITTGFIPATVYATAPDWSSVPEKTITLFYPGQSSWQWLRSRDHKRADKQVRAGASCVSCHEGEEQIIGEKTVSGKRLESLDLVGKQATIVLRVQAAYDDTNLYWRFRWDTKNPFPGRAHPQLRYDGKQWAQYGYPRLHQQVQSSAQPAIYEDRLSIMLDDGRVPYFKQQGCWVTCHSSERDMPDVAAREQVRQHPLLGEKLKRSDVRKYLPPTRTDAAASWDKTRTEEQIAQLKAAGEFLDLMQWRAHRSNPVGMADDGYVLEYRLFDAGRGPFGSNLDKERHQPKWMYDKGTTGVRALKEGELRDPAKPYALVREENAVEFDPSADWQPGEMVPEYVVSRADTGGSAADNGNVTGEWKDGAWTVVWTRPLDTGHPEDDKILREGGTYTVGFAVHDDNITTRGHHVSFPLSLGVGAKADIEAVKVP